MSFDTSTTDSASRTHPTPYSPNRPSFSVFYRAVLILFSKLLMIVWKPLAQTVPVSADLASDRISPHHYRCSSAVTDEVPCSKVTESFVYLPSENARVNSRLYCHLLSTPDSGFHATVVSGERTRPHEPLLAIEHKPKILKWSVAHKLAGTVMSKNARLGLTCVDLQTEFADTSVDFTLNLVRCVDRTNPENVIAVATVDSTGTTGNRGHLAIEIQQVNI